MEEDVIAADGSSATRSHRAQIDVPWSGEVTKSQLYDSYEQYCRKQRKHPDAMPTFFTDLRRKYAVLGKVRRPGAGSRVYVVGLRDIAEARATFGKAAGWGPHIWDDATPADDVREANTEVVSDTRGATPLSSDF